MPGPKSHTHGRQQAAVGLLLGLGLAALGGTMMPLEFFTPTLRAVAHLTPHACVVDGFTTLVRRNGDVVAILPELGVLLGMATALFVLAVWRFRRIVSR